MKVGDVIAVCDKSRSTARFKKLVEDDKFVAAPKWLEKDLSLIHSCDDDGAIQAFTGG